MPLIVGLFTTVIWGIGLIVRSRSEYWMANPILPSVFDYSPMVVYWEKGMEFMRECDI